MSLSPNEVVDVTVVFNPTAIGNWNPQNIAISTDPVNGDNQLVCKGKAVAAEFKIGFSATTLNFGKKPVNSSQSTTLTITNTGTKPMSVSSFGATADGYTVAAFNVSLTCGQSFPVPIAFIPPSEGPHTATFSVAHSAPGNPTTITLLGEGCIANAEIVVPATAPIDFGQVQRGFRTVRFITVSNPADGQLTFSAAIGGPDAALFGLPDPNGSVIDPPSTRNYTVDPVSPCGNLTIGTGETVVAVAFFAGVAAEGGERDAHAEQPQCDELSRCPDVDLPFERGDHASRSRSTLRSLSTLRQYERRARIALEDRRRDFREPAIRRTTAANLDDRVAIVRFNDERNVVVPMTAVSTTISPTQNEIRQKVDTDIKPAEGLTAIAGGTMLGIHEVEKPHPGNPSPLNKAVVVLTDGIENTGFEEPVGNWLSILGGKMPNPTQPPRPIRSTRQP